MRLQLPVRKTSKDNSSHKHTSHVDGLSHLLQGAQITHQLPLTEMQHSLTHMI